MGRTSAPSRHADPLRARDRAAEPARRGGGRVGRCGLSRRHASRCSSRRAMGTAFAWREEAGAGASRGVTRAGDVTRCDGRAGRAIARVRDAQGRVNAGRTGRFKDRNQARDGVTARRRPQAGACTRVDERRRRGGDSRTRERIRPLRRGAAAASTNCPAVRTCRESLDLVRSWPQAVGEVQAERGGDGVPDLPVRVASVATETARRHQVRATTPASIHHLGNRDGGHDAWATVANSLSNPARCTSLLWSAGLPADVRCRWPHELPAPRARRRFCHLPRFAMRGLASQPSKVCRGFP